jgi:hypothetical protein
MQPCWSYPAVPSRGEMISGAHVIIHNKDAETPCDTLCIATP